MGSRSKSSNTSGQTQGTMNQLARGRTDNSLLMGQQAQMRNDMLSQVAPMFDAMVQNGMSVFNSNPMGGGAPMPMMSITDIMNALQPPTPEVEEQNQRSIYEHGMTPQQLAAIEKFKGYGGPQR